jgi:Putative DNA-binding domain
VGSIHQSVTSFDRDALVGLCRRPLSNLRTDNVVSAHCDRTSPIEVLAARYPVIRQLVGELSFRIVARRFILSKPPSAPIPLSYGDNFPGFLRNQGTLASIEYVADIAELEMARGRARYAADARPLAAAALSPLQTRRLHGLRVVLHPSVCLVQSRFPIVTIWESSQRGGGVIDRWGYEAALVARPRLEVEVRRLPPGGYAFLRALSEGQMVATAAAIATDATPRFEICANLAVLQDANVVVAIQESA